MYTEIAINEWKPWSNTSGITRHGVPTSSVTQVRDGRTDKAEVLQKFCGDQLPAPLSSSGSALWMKFHSDESDQYKGFKLNYKRSEPSKLQCFPQSP